MVTSRAGETRFRLTKFYQVELVTYRTAMDDRAFPFPGLLCALFITKSIIDREQSVILNMAEKKYYCRSLTSELTTEASASVEISPRFSVSPLAIFRRILRMILPLRVFGRLRVNCSLSGVAIGPITVRT